GRNPFFLTHFLLFIFAVKGLLLRFFSFYAAKRVHCYSISLSLQQKGVAVKVFLHLYYKKGNKMINWMS
ncbi:hypothetical protein MKW98_030154, partial [Papaver atlanticum]